MRRLTLPSVVVVGALALLPPGTAGQPPAAGAGKSAATLRQLSRADDEWVDKKAAESVKFGRAGKWGFDEAQAPAREILALGLDKLGPDHYLVGEYRREIEALKKLTARPQADKDEYLKTYTLYDTMNESSKEKRYADAVRATEQMRDIYRRILGPDTVYEAQVAKWRGQILHADNQFAAAEKQFREGLRIWQGIVGEEHPEVAQLHLNLARDLEYQGQEAEAGRHYEAALKLMTRLRGENDRWTSVAGNNLAGHLERLARYADAEQLYRRALDALLACDRDVDTLLATAYNNLALNVHHQARYDEAEDLFNQAISIRRRLKDEDGAEMGRVYMNLASNVDAQGNVRRAESLYRQALAAYTKEYGPKHVETAWALHNLALNLNKQSKHEEAERKLRDALEVVLHAPGDQNRAVAKMTSNLASCLRDQEKLADAEALCEKALSILRDRLAPDHPDLAAVINNVAANLTDQDRHTDAERHFRDSLTIMVKRMGPDHPDTALGRVNLGVNLWHQGRFRDADEFFREALASYRRVLGEGHPSTAWAYRNVIGNACAGGQYGQAEALTEAASASFEAARVRLGYAGLERSRRAPDVTPYPCLAVATARRQNGGAAWQALERNLARGLLDDLSARRLDDAERRREQALLDKLDLLDRRIDGFRSLGQKADLDRRQVERDRDAAQTELVQFQDGLAVKYGVPAGQVYDLDRIQKQLPEDMALLAWVDLPPVPNWDDPKGDHWACLVRRHGDPVWVQLPGSGTERAWTDADDRLAILTRRALAERPTDAAGQWSDLARRLALQRFAPLKDHLKAANGRPAVRHLVVLPSPQLKRIPVETLTDRLKAIPEMGLADRLTVSYAPSGTMFAWLRERQVGREASAATLLALGDPAFRPAGAGEGRGEFGRLEWTLHELRGISRLNFERVERLTGPAANERNLDRLARDGLLREFRYLHFATHGVLDNQQPMRSALILASDRPADAPGQVRNATEARDGRLTAERILRHWKLDADLVTLSACNTGLGQYAGGEGHLGFSQALFLAGARSLVLSLWEVDDASTALLMTRFYENLIGESEVKPMAKAEALAEAKQWLRTLEPAEVIQLTKDLPTRGTRGKLVPRNPTGPGPAVRSYEHPYYWSGFILIGDPR